MATMIQAMLLVLICVYHSNCEKKEKDENAPGTDIEERILLSGPPAGENAVQISNPGSTGHRTPTVPQPPLLPQEGSIFPVSPEGTSTVTLPPFEGVEDAAKHALYLYLQQDKNYRRTPPKYSRRRIQYVDPMRQQHWYHPRFQNLYLPRYGPLPNFQRYRSMLMVPEPGIANVGKFGFPLLSHVDESRAPTNEDFDEPVQLLPKCSDHIPGCTKLRYIIDLFDRNETKSIAHKLKSENFPTRGILLREILQQLMETDTASEEVLNKVKEYAHQMEEQPSAPMLEPVYTNLLYALPDPSSEQEKSTLDELKNWLMNTDITLEMGKDFNPYPHKTKASLLKYILEKSLETSEMSQNLKEAMEYWIQHISNIGIGAEPVDWVLVTKKVTRKTVDMRSIVKVINQKKLKSQKQQKLMKELNEFFEKEFNPEVHMKGIDIMKYKTKGELFTAFVENLLEKPDLKQELRTQFETIKPFIQLNGPGEEPVEYI